MDKIAMYKEQIYKRVSIEKVAKNKAQKILNSGRLSEEVAEKLFKKNPITNNLNNRINARAKRLKEGLFPKGQINAEKFLKISKPNNLKSRAAIDTQRVMKHYGHENSKVVSELRRQAVDGVNVVHSGNQALDGKTNLRWNTLTGNPAEWNIKIPSKDARRTPLYGASFSNGNEKILNEPIAKETRAMTARHEISGEATAQSRMLRALRNKGYDTDNFNLDLFRINNHTNPDVLVGDAKMAKRMSPQTQKIFSKKNKANFTGINNRSINEGLQMNESQLMNRLRMKYGDNNITGKVRKDIENTPYFKKKLPNDQELKDSMKRMGKINTGESDDVLEEVADSYMKTPFFHTKKKKK